MLVATHFSPLGDRTVTASDTAAAQSSTAQPVITGIDLSAYLTPNPARAVAFYRDILGMAPTEVDTEGRGAEFTLPDGSTFGVWQPDSGPTSGGTIMFAVADIDAAAAQFRARGLELSDVSETPVCRMVFASDPDGNGIIIHQRKTSA
jgi:predicted enzyme related to lactoylglutathione lyase